MRRTGQQPLPHVVTKEWLFERASKWPAGAVMREQWGQELTSASVPDGAPLPTLSGRPGRLLPEVALARDSGGLSCCPHCEETQRWAASAPRRVTCRPTAPAICRAASEVVGTSRGPSGAALGWAVHTASGSPGVPGGLRRPVRPVAAQMRSDRRAGGGKVVISHTLGEVKTGAGLVLAR